MKNNRKQKIDRIKVVISEIEISKKEVNRKNKKYTK